MLYPPKKPFWVSFLNAVSYLLLVGSFSSGVRLITGSTHRSNSGSELLFVVIIIVLLVACGAYFQNWQDKVWPDKDRYKLLVSKINEKNPKLVSLGMSDLTTFLVCLFFNHKAEDRYQKFDMKKFANHIYSEWRKAKGHVGLGNFSTFIHAASALRWGVSSFPSTGSRYNLCLMALSDLKEYVHENEGDLSRIISSEELYELKALLGASNAS